MARVVAENGNALSHNSDMELRRIPRISGDSGGGSPTLGDLLEKVDSMRKEEVAINSRRYSHDPSNMIPPELRPIPFLLSFNNLTYKVKVQQKFSFKKTVNSPEEGELSSTSKTLLDNISGEARDGEILAVLGASGSGKSTLIDALADQISKESLKGTVNLNGETLHSKVVKVIAAYVKQDDVLFPMLTVEETLTYAAEFRLPRSLSKSKKKLRVQALIEQLGLRCAAKTIVGDEGHRGISGGERRRVSIGIDIIHNPILLFLDEPTSGLDSTNAFMVVQVLKRIAQSGSIVIMSIHQPSYRILGLLDRLIFLSRGRTVYTGTPANLPYFFSEFGYTNPENENPTEFTLDLIRELEKSPTGTEKLVEFNSNWQRKHTNSSSPQQNLSLKEAITASISRGKLVPAATKDEAAISSMVLTFANPMWTEVSVLSRRSLTNSIRMPEVFGVQFTAVLLTGFMLASVFWQLDDSINGVQERLGFFTFAMSTMYYTCADALPVFIAERFIFMRETAHNTYRLSSYVLSRSLVVIPPLVLLSVGFAGSTFPTIGLDGGIPGFFFYFLIIFASFWAGSSFVTLLSTFVTQVMLGYTIIVANLAYFLLFSGFFVHRDRIPLYWIWLHYISLLKYSYEAVLRNEFGDPTKCLVRGIQAFDNSPLSAFPDAMKVKLLDSLGSSLGITITGSTCLTTGNDILKAQAISSISKWDCLWITFAWGFFFRVLFYFSLLFGSKNKRV